MMSNTAAGTAQNYDIQKPLSIGDWILTLIALSIPFVGLIFLLYWALSSSSNVNRKNYCIALILLAAIFIAFIISLFFLGFFAGFLAEFTQQRLLVMNHN